MSNRTPITDTNEQASTEACPREGPSRERMDRGRRKFALAASSAPILFAMVNKPLMAGTCEADTPSGFDSAKASGRKGDRTTLECGRSPGYWGNNGNGGGSDDSFLLNEENTFLYVFESNNHIKQLGEYDKDLLTMRHVVVRTYHTPTQLNFRDEGNLARAFVAAYMNALRVDNYPLSTVEVKAMWKAIDGGGKYQVTAGVEWGKPEVLTYLWSTYEDPPEDNEDEYFDVED